MNRKFAAGIALALALTLQAGCSSAGKVEDNKNVENGVRHETPAEPSATKDNGQKKIMEDFDDLLANNAQITEIIKFIDANIPQVSKENASKMVCGLEEAQKKYLPELDGKFSSDEDIQKEMDKEYKPGFDINMLDDIQNENLKALLTEARDGGFKIETAEGMFFPVINYEFHKRYSSYVTEDIKDYIDIMAVESGKVPAKDAALVIGWEEIVERALSQEKFLKEHGGSVRADEVKKLYDKYVSFTLYGLNNTPLFSYDTKTIDAEAKAAYTKAVESGGDSEYLKMLKSYLDVLEKNNYKLTDEVEKFRKDNSDLSF